MNDIFKKHVDTITILATFCAGLMWMNGKFNDIDKQFSEIEKELSIVKTVLIMRDIMPKELAINEEK